MTYSKYSGRAVSILFFLPLILSAQRVHDTTVPLKNWATPLYWHPNQTETQAAAARALPHGAAAPQISFSATQVSPDALTFVAITPCRVVDTRGLGAPHPFTGVTPFNGPALASGATQTYLVQSMAQASTSTPAPCGTIPPIAEAYSFNVTVVPHGGGAVDYITVWPAGATQPIVSTLNDVEGEVVANAAIVPAGAPMVGGSPNPDAGGVTVYNSGPAVTDLIIDMNGFYTAPTDLYGNTAIGAGSLANVNGGGGGTGNTATGSDSLQSNTTGVANTANGFDALSMNTTGGDNTAIGFQALYYNNGSSNTAFGYTSLYANTSGGSNTATGSGSLTANTMGSNNAAFGNETLELNTTGNNNVAFGYQAGSAAPAGNNDSIYIGSLGTGSDLSGSISIGTEAAETTATIQIGSAQAGGTSIAGIYGATPSANMPAPVCVDSNGILSNGSLGICSALETLVLSSIRFKEQVADMGDSTDKLLQLRPVTFLYKPQYDDGSHALQFGLIAEEVAKLYPEMVRYDKDGQPAALNYQPLTPMLLNEVQKQHAEVQKLNGEIEKQTEVAQQQDETIRQLQDRLAAVESLLSKVPATSAAGQ